MRLRNSEYKETKSWSSIVSETYKDFAENTSIHGLKYTVKNEIGSCEKIFWFFVVLSGLCGAGYMTVLFWERYTSNPTRTTILTSYARVNSMPFPAVTICNINRILLMNMDKLLDTMPADSRDRVVLKESLPQLLSFNYNNHRYLNVSQLDDLNSVLIANQITDISYLVKSLGQSCEEMLQYCRWGTEYIKCSEYFQASLTTDGYCCSFNYLRDDVLYTSINGVSTGLVVVLDPMLQNTQYSSLHAAGFKVIIHDPTEYPGAQSRSKIISPGHVAYLQIVGTKMVCSEAVKQLPISQRDCIYGDEGPTKAFKIFEGDYSDSNCLTECEAICNITEIPCLLNVKSDRAKTVKHSLCNCMPQCEDDFYDILSTTSKLEYNQSMCVHTLNDHVVVNIFFLGQTQTIYLRDTVTSTVYLLSSFGGVYGLFIGCSIITIIEIIYYCFFRFVVNLNIFGKVTTDYEVSQIQHQKGSRSFTIGMCNPEKHDFYSENVHHSKMGGERVVFIFLGLLSLWDYRISNKRFPSDFKFGVATCAYQVEGAWNEDGKGENIWDTMTHTHPEKIIDGSNAWSRILPDGTLDNINQKGIDYYMNLLQELHRNGIEPMVTLYHWDLPTALQNKGGWMNNNVVGWFTDYARLCFQHFGPLVKHWATINEPKQICHAGYGIGIGAPGKITIVLDSDWYEPGTPADEAAAEVRRQFVGTFDYLSINHYTTYMVSAIPEPPVGHPSWDVDAGVRLWQKQEWETAAIDWFKVVPWGFHKLLRWMKQTYGDYEIYVTENGYSDRTGELDDLRRISYYKRYMSHMLDCINEGIRIIGYTAWSIIDNYEWNMGYVPRRPRKSSYFYNHVITTRCLLSQCEG
ncbi:unnamed protein product [Callosobruchus maculatus]|uniref:Uncharacterized protein n=1 Tax=Callosobruchus maculatus TaxID=64391 RepID=A0A653BKR3_CALMS|nr:unnamed protein product [Callosobruchus maculatus]